MKHYQNNERAYYHSSPVFIGLKTTLSPYLLYVFISFKIRLYACLKNTIIFQNFETHMFPLLCQIKPNHANKKHLSANNYKKVTHITINYKPNSCYQFQYVANEG